MLGKAKKWQKNWRGFYFFIGFALFEVFGGYCSLVRECKGIMYSYSGFCKMSFLSVNVKINFYIIRYCFLQNFVFLSGMDWPVAAVLQHLLQCHKYLAQKVAKSFCNKLC